MGARAKHPLSPTVRGAFLRALGDIEDQQGLTFSELMKREILDKGVLHVLGVISRYAERDNQHTVEIGENTLVGILASYGARDDRSVESTTTEVRH